MTMMWKEIMEQPEVIERCGVFNEKTISDIVGDAASHNVRFVVIVARGTSDHAAVYGKYMIELYTGLPVSLAAPSVFTLYNGNVNYKDCLVVGISQSGAAEDVLEVVKAAALQGAVTASITNFPESPLAKAAKYHLHCNAGIEISVAATKTFTAQIYLLAMLAARLSENNDLQKELLGVPGKIQKTLEIIEDQVEDVVKRYRFIKECFVLARGFNYAVALEAALKIQETTYLRAKAFATSDFHHGPFAMVERDMPIIVYAPDGPSLSNAHEMIDKLKHAEGDLLVVSNNKDILKKGDCFLQIPEGCSDVISPFCNAAVAQMFACKLSVSKGLNPDNPRGLNKVTVTK